MALKEYEAAACALKIQPQSLQVRDRILSSISEFQVAAKARLDALVFITVALIIGYSKRIADLAIKNRLRCPKEVTKQRPVP